MDRITVREAYGHNLPLGIDAQVPHEILDLDEYDVPSWEEISKMRAHVDELMAQEIPWLEGEDLAARSARRSAINAALLAEAESVICAANRYAAMRHGIEKVRRAARWGVAPLVRSNHFGSF